MINFRKTTDSDVTTEIGTVDAGDGTRILINVKLHPADIDKLHDVLHSFLKNQCSKTNDFLTRLEKEYTQYQRETTPSIDNQKKTSVEGVNRKTNGRIIDICKPN